MLVLLVNVVKVVQFEITLEKVICDTHRERQFLYYRFMPPQLSSSAELLGKEFVFPWAND